MANIPASGASAQSQHATLTAGAADTVTLDQAYRTITVQNWDASTPLYFTLDNGAANTAAPTPTIGGPGTFRVGPGGTWEVPDDAASAANPSSVKLIAAAAVAYTVSGTN